MRATHTVSKSFHRASDQSDSDAMKNCFRFALLVLIVLAIFHAGCVRHIPLMTFAFEDEIVAVQKSDIERVSKTTDAGGGTVVVLVMTNDAQERLARATKKYLNTKVDIYFKNEIISRNITVLEGVAMSELQIAVESEDKADEMVNSWKDE
jgi:preprotein translocase subunit SecD